MSDTYLARHEWEPLRRKLSAVPELVEDLAITLTRCDHIQKPGLGKPARRRLESVLPMHIGAADTATELHNCLAGWTRLVCEQRHIDYVPIGFVDPDFIGPLRDNQQRLPDGYDTNAMPVLARWLRTNIPALAMTEGSAEAYDDIASHIDACRRIVDLPADDDIIIDKKRVEKANRQVLTAGQIEKIAPKLGDLGTGLTRKRVTYLRVSGLLKGWINASDADQVSAEWRYHLGDVLAAHQTAKVYKQGKGRRA